MNLATRYWSLLCVFAFGCGNQTGATTSPTGGANGSGGSSTVGTAGTVASGGALVNSGGTLGTGDASATIGGTLGTGGDASATIGGTLGTGGMTGTDTTTPAAGTFVHPGCLSTQRDLDRMKAKVTAGEQPWKGSWDKLLANTHAQLTYVPNPQQSICAGGVCATENYMTLAHDAAAAYQLALRFHITGDTAFADRATLILDAWATTLTSFTGDSNTGLRAALYGYQLACAGELLRSYAAWSPARLQTLLTTVFYPIHSDFLVNHNGACEGNYWANWDLANVASVVAIGVFADRYDIFQEGVNYFRTGVGEGSIDNAVKYVHPDGSGQWQEAGRDQGHSTLGPMLVAVICEIAWNQGVDLYSYAAHRFLLGSEYVATYNLGNDVPYVTYIYWSGPQGSCTEGVQSTISATGRGSQRPGWEIIYNHFVNRLGLAAPFTEQYAAALRPEGGGGDYGGTSGGFDSLGFTTLTHALDPIAHGAVPTSLRPFVQGRQVTLSWVGSQYATSYKVKRATVSGGPYTTLATISADRTFNVDPGLTAGVTYYYVVSAVDPSGESDNSVQASAAADGQLFGTVIGTSGSFNSLGTTRDLAFDGFLGNFFDAPDSAAWTGLDLGEGVAAVVTAIKYAPRKNFSGRMVGGKFQGSNTADFSAGVTDLFSVTSEPADGQLTTQLVSNTQTFRYLRYVSPPSGYGNVAEIQFLGTIATAP